MKPPILPTPRLLLRRWADDDREVFAWINADPRVSRYRFEPLTREQSDVRIDDIEACFDDFDARWTHPAIRTADSCSTG